VGQRKLNISTYPTSCVYYIAQYKFVFLSVCLNRIFVLHSLNCLMFTLQIYNINSGKSRLRAKKFHARKTELRWAICPYRFCTVSPVVCACQVFGTLFFVSGQKNAVGVDRPHIPIASSLCPSTPFLFPHRCIFRSSGTSSSKTFAFPRTGVQ